MKRNLIISLALATVCAVCMILSNDYNSSDMLLKENVEALTTNEASPCYPNNNGYKNWEPSVKIKIFNTKKEFYDCCTIIREGYNPTGNCNG